MSHSPSYHRTKAAAKLLLGLAIVAYLVYQAGSHQKFAELLQEPKRWEMLVASLACVTASVLLIFVRWYLLVRAVGLSFTLHDAFRLGSLGFAMNFVGPGGVGGDLFRAVALAREHTGQKGEAIATVVADRLVGLVSLLAVTSGAILISGLLWDASVRASVRGLAGITLAALATVLTVGGLLMAPGRIGTGMARLLSWVPLVGKVAGKLFVTCQMVSRRPKHLMPAMALGIIVHLLLVLSFHTVAVGLSLEHPQLGKHFCIVPLAETAGAIPITPGGLGTTEAALAGLYASIGFDPNSGVIVALGQRLVMLSVGIVAIIYFFAQRRKIDRELHEAEAVA